ncbi:MAG: tryptophan synthase subunit alpha [Candidatus Omnitrophota bacterium]|nr:tryptophan synthase subunit alpha [Candidatus Omnitrophota bacterium]
MNRIDETFKKLKAENRTAFIPYITAGDPDIASTKKLALILASAGADIIELGIPFSDPLADGPTIQKAVERALKAGCSVKKVFNTVKELRNSIQTPLVFMTYYNIVFNYGIEKFVRDAKASGADGIIVPDLPMEESCELKTIADKYEFDVIMLTAPTTPIERFKKISSFSKGFVYYVSVTGVTGARDNISCNLKNEIKSFRKVTNKPLCVGFGVSSALQAKDVAKTTDGVIVGSAIIKKIEKNIRNKTKMMREVKTFASDIAKAVHGG